MSNPEPSAPIETSDTLDSLLLELGPAVGLVVDPARAPAEWTVVPLPPSTSEVAA